ncbi:hypothetical protein [Caballeronia sordidicola]|jgi:hypothetical protein|uniref:hypothetical protein n=1 Tax=Caballeronia sordidicola TaxID=196367 RepID=UPI000B118A40|nr:hypothetical protein [Caballeronia sordidicola]
MDILDDADWRRRLKGWPRRHCMSTGALAILHQENACLNGDIERLGGLVENL